MRMKRTEACTTSCANWRLAEIHKLYGLGNNPDADMNTKDRDKAVSYTHLTLPTNR